MAKDYELINHESNILMLESGVHKDFGEFKIVLEATTIPNQYRIKGFPNATGLTMSLMPTNRLVQFTVKEGSYALPDPNLLRVHASIGNFIHMMGMGEKLDKLIDDYDGCAGLAPSGSTDVAGLLALRGLSLLSPNTFMPRVSQRSKTKKIEENQQTNEEGYEELY
jgi:hypothetical protein